jgi:hypothetical protein
MTQTQLRTVYRVRGKDRMSSPWITAEFRFRWQAEQWAAERAFTLGEPEQTRPSSPLRVEWLVRGAWIAYTAWYDPEHYDSMIRNMERRPEWDPVNRYRLVYQDDPAIVIGI